MEAASLPYHEPGIVTILTQASFILLLNVGNFLLDHSLYCGLIGQIFLGVAWGTPGAKWLGEEAEHVIVQLGYLGLLLIVYEGGLSTSLRALKANLLLSAGVAVTGIGLPMGLSFVLQKLTGATPLQCFAAGAALCSTSLGTTFTVLGASGLMTSRLGVVLTSAAMMDDVIGLVMVQIISNLGTTSTNISAGTVVRPILVSLGFAIGAPLVCRFLVQPFTLFLNAKRVSRPQGFMNQILAKGGVVWCIHTLILLGCIAASSYAGTSNLFAAYIAGAATSWWDAEVPHPVFPLNETSAREQNDNQDVPVEASEQSRQHVTREPKFSGMLTFEKYYLQPLNRVLRPFFFASIGFSIPISKMFNGQIVWKGLVYTVLMTIGKLFCGAWLLRLPTTPGIAILSRKLSKLKMAHFWGKAQKQPNTAPNTSGSPTNQTSEALPPSQPGQDSTVRAAARHSNPSSNRPISLYPASILGCAMTARGEIGFLISSIAESNGTFSSGHTNSSGSSDIFLIVTWAIMLCTIIGPLAVGIAVRRVKQLQNGVVKDGRHIREDVLGIWGIS